MKKFLIMFLLIFTGCSTSKLLNTPTKKTEMFFSKYQALDDEVLNQLKGVVNNELSFFEDDKDKYIELMKNHYQTLKYEIKDEVIDGDMAVVTVEIDVLDYSKILKDTEEYYISHKEEFNDENNEYDERMFNRYRIEKLKDAKERVKFTIDIKLTKIEDEWTIDDLDQKTEEKIEGIYRYF